MPWTRLDDGFFANPKIVALGNVAFRLYVSALNWSVAHLTDGRIPAHIDAIVLPLERPRTRAAATNELVDSGLWTLNGVGFVIHDFDDYQESKEQVEARRERWAERKRETRKGSPRRTPPETPNGSPRPPRARSHPIPKEEPNGSSQKAIFGALENHFGPVSPNYQSLRGKVAAGLVALGAKPEDIPEYAAVWKQLWKDETTLTETALEKYWGRLGLLVKAKGLKLKDCAVCRNQRVVGLLEDGSETTLDDLEATSTRQCRCVKEAK